MKWIVSLFIFALVVFFLKKVEPTKSQAFISETLPVLSFKCEDVWRTNNMLNISFKLKSGEYLFKTQLKEIECEHFNNNVKVGSLANVVYFPAGYKRFSLVSININNQFWVKQ